MPRAPSARPYQRPGKRLLQIKHLTGWPWVIAGRAQPVKIFFQQRGKGDLGRQLGIGEQRQIDILLAAQMAGYKSEADMEAQLEQPSEIVAEEVDA